MDPMSAIDRSWPALNRLVGLHTALYRVTRGVVGHRIPFAPPMLLLDHVGARSGTLRTVPLVYVDDPPNVVIVASKGGNPKNPAWYHNLKANPDTTVQIGSERRPVHAREATDQERGRLWRMAVATYGPYEDYQERTDRKIPLVVLEPRAG
jgi:deazaflavin-dependent oxidoreductase (nitroreductase family)